MLFQLGPFPVDFLLLKPWHHTVEIVHQEIATAREVHAKQLKIPRAHKAIVIVVYERKSELHLLGTLQLNQVSSQLIDEATVANNFIL